MGFAERLKELIDKAADGNQSAFIRMCKEVDEENAPSYTMVGKYLDGASPTLERLVVMAIAGGVSLDWLAGMPSKPGSEDTSKQPLPNGVQARVFVGDQCILSGVLTPTETPLEIGARVHVGEVERVEG